MSTFEFLTRCLALCGLIAWGVPFVIRLLLLAGNCYAEWRWKRRAWPRRLE